MIRNLLTKFSNVALRNARTCTSVPTKSELNENSSLLDQLSAHYEHAAHVRPLLSDPGMKTVTFEDWDKRIRLLMIFFTESQSFKFISNYPKILKIPFQSLEYNVNQWSICGIQGDALASMILAQPSMITVPHDEIQTRVGYFSTLTLHKSSIINLVTHCPNVMFDNWEVIQAKVLYLYKEKKISTGELFHSNALEHPLDFIKLRINLLEKCGVFKAIPIYPHKVNKQTKKSNPLLSDITDTDDTVFSKQIAGITTEEYHVFCDLQNDEMDTDYDDDDDDEDDE